MKKADVFSGRPLRLIGVFTSKAEQSEYEQLDLFQTARNEKQEKLDKAIDQIRKKYGEDSVRRARFLDGEMKRLGVECVRDTEGSLFVLGDKDLLYRAVYNILVNAYQAIGTNGTIHIRGERRDDGMIALSFHDSGPGFPPALLHKLLDPFFTTKDHGTGLGLPIVNTIITSHNGKLLLTNPEEGGAMITILLPVASEPDIGDTPEKDERPAASADDEPVTLTDPLPSEKHDLREGDASPQTR